METQRHEHLNDALNSQLPKADLPTLTLPQRSDRVYRGVRHADGSCAVTVEESSSSSPTPEAAKVSRPLPLHLELGNHSPTGFAWGYGGSGPAQLALAILMDATGETTLALRHYQNFKFSFVADWEDSWHITQREIQSYVIAQESLAGCHEDRSSCRDC